MNDAKEEASEQSFWYIIICDVTFLDLSFVRQEYITDEHIRWLGFFWVQQLIR